ncbi:MAG: PKD domain-containing protein, partial [Cyclobacteriaceae bacterium]|nr:PKD domain-containing protein [Cyclobacteriaceae bacterium]
MDNLSSPHLAPTSLTDISLKQNYNLSVETSAGQWYGFVANRSANSLLRMRFGNDLERAPQFEDLGNIGGMLSSPIDVELVQSNGNWYGLVVNFASNSLVLLEFGKDLGGIPTAKNLGGFGTLGAPIGLWAGNDGTKHVALITNNANTTMTLLNFGDSYSNTPVATSFAIGGSSGNRDLSLYQANGKWNGLINSKGNNKVFYVEFGSEVTSMATLSEVLISGLTFQSPSGIDIVSQQGKHYAYISSENAGNIYKLDLGDNTVIAGEDLGNLGGLTGNPGLAMVRYGQRHYGFTSDYGNSEIDRFTFGEDCPGSLGMSSEPDPSGLSYDSSGVYPISLIAFDNVNDTYSELEMGVTVTSSRSPDIRIGVDDSRCVSNPNTFRTVTSSGDIISYSWDFDGDGIEDSNVDSAVYQYGSPGTYPVRLDVTSSAGCPNQARDTITLYPAPVTPVFDYSAAALCSNSPISFTNQTDETGLGGIIQYSWDFNGETSSSEKSPTYTFSTPGLKTVGLTAYIPGCTTLVYSREIQISEGPAVGYSYRNNCFGSAIQFTDTTQGTGLTSYSWDFGDGTMNDVSQHPQHTYVTTGDYEVRLVVSNSNGCTSSHTRTVSVVDTAKAGFIYGSSIENLPISFEGQDYTPADDRVLTWLWDFSGQGTSTIPNAQYTYQSSGDYMVSLTVETEQGCSYQTQQLVSVSASSVPTARAMLMSSMVCMDETVTIENQSVNAGEYRWNFCMDNLSSPHLAPTSLTDISLKQNYNLSVETSAGQWYGFVANRSANSLLRMRFGNDLERAPQFEDLGNIGGMLSSPIDIELVQSNGNWYGLVVNFGSNSLVLLEFGKDLGGIPTAKNLGGFGTLGAPIGLWAGNDGTKHVALVTNNANTTVTLLNFGDSYSNTPVATSFTIGGSSGNRDLSLYQANGKWNGLINSKGNNKVFYVEFGSEVTSMTRLSEVLLSGLTFQSPSGIDIVSQQGKHYAYISSENAGNIYKLDLGDTTVIAGEDLGNLGRLTGNPGLAMVRYGQRHYGFTSDYGNSEIDRFTFGEDC